MEKSHSTHIKAVFFCFFFVFDIFLVFYIVVKTSGMNDELDMLNGELYYSLLRVTNALDYTYIIRSNGVTVKQEPLIPGKVFDGEVIGYDLSFLRSKAMVTAHWDGFGLPVNTKVQVDVLSGKYIYQSSVY
jgi:hypothetical protein